MASCGAVSGGSNLGLEIAVQFSRLDAFIGWGSMKREAMDRSSIEQSTFAVIVASDEEWSQQFELPV